MQVVNIVGEVKGIRENSPLANHDIQARGGEIDQKIENLKESLTDFKISSIKKEIRGSLRGELTLTPFESLQGRNLLIGIGGNLLTLARNLLGVSFVGARNLATALLVSRPPVIEKALFLVEEIAAIEEDIRSLRSDIQTPSPIMRRASLPIDLQSKEESLLLIKQEVNQFLLAIPDEDLDIYGSLGISQRFYGSDEAVVSDEQYRKLLDVREKAEREDLTEPVLNQRIQDLNRRQAVLGVGGEAAKNAAIGVGLCVAAKISVIGVQKAKSFGEKLVESSAKAKDQFMEGATKATGQMVERASNAYADLGKKVADSLAGVYISVDENTIVPKIAGVVVGIGLATFAAYKLGMFRRRPDPAAAGAV